MTGLTNAVIIWVLLGAAADPTHVAVSTLLNELWVAPADKVVSKGNAARSRGRRQDADNVAINLAYASLLLHHQQWDAAKGVLRQLCDQEPFNADAWLLAVFENFHSGKTKVALKTLQSAYQRAPEDLSLALTVATIAGFHENYPVPDLDQRTLLELEQAVQSTLNEEGRQKYVTRRREAAEFVLQLDKLRQIRLEPLNEKKFELEQATVALNQMQARWQAMKNDYDRRTANIADLAAQINNLRIYYQNLINSSDDPGRRAEYSRQLQASVAPLQFRQQAESQACADLDRQARALTAQMQPLKVKHEQLSKFIGDEQARIERELSLPPLEVNPNQMRGRLLEGVASGTAMPEISGTPTVLPPKQPTDSSDSESVSDERKAEGMLRNAKVLLSATRKDAGVKKLRELIQRYPNTESAKQAQQILNSQ